MESIAPPPDILRRLDATFGEGGYRLIFEPEELWRGGWEPLTEVLTGTKAVFLFTGLPALSLALTFRPDMTRTQIEELWRVFVERLTQMAR